MIPGLEDKYFITVGNPGNLPDPFAYPYYWGSVPYQFEISKRPVTVGEWVNFLNSVAATEDPHSLYNEKMGSWITQQEKDSFYCYQLVDTATRSKPITHVSYESAQRYCNWQENGKKKGDMES